MKHRAFLSATFILVVSLTSCGITEPEYGSIEGKIRHNYSVFSGATVFTSPASCRTSVNNDGTFLLTEVPPGEYIVYARTNFLGHEGSSTKVIVEARKTANAGVIYL